MALFAAVNLVVFQPWDWDDHKLLVYWFLAVALVVGRAPRQALAAAPGRSATRTLVARSSS